MTMPQKNKGRDGNGAKTQPQTTEEHPLPAPARQPSWSPVRRAEHPLTHLRDEMDALFDRFFGRSPTPREWSWDPERLWDVDVEDADKEILVRAEAPGFEPKDFDIHVSGNTLTIRAERGEKAEHKEGDVRSWERGDNRFERSVPWPAAVDAD